MSTRRHCRREHFRGAVADLLYGLCETLGVPYLIVRAGSNVGQEAPNDHYLRLGPIAAREAANFSLYLLSCL